MVNAGEMASYLDLRSVASDNDASVHLGTKLSDVTDPRLAEGDFDWATRAHIDLLIRDDQALRPMFAIEIDGRQHADEEQARRDRVKDRLLETAGIDVFRITTATALRRHGKDRLAAYLARIWFMARQFDAAKEAGHFASDESFWHTCVIVDDGRGGKTSMNPTMEFRRRLALDHADKGTPVVWVPQTWVRTRGDVGLVDARVVLAFTDDLFLYAEATVGRITAHGIQNRDIAEEAALLDLQWQYEQLRRGEPMARRVADLSPLLPPEATMLNLMRTDGSWGQNSGFSLFFDWLVEAVGQERAASVCGDLLPPSSAAE